MHCYAVFVLDHPMLYQIAHPWHWLTYGAGAQNAVALQAVAAAVATGAAIFAGVYARNAYRATKETLTVTRQQAALERERYDDERRARRSADWAEFVKLKREEESARPRFRLDQIPFLFSNLVELGCFGDIPATDVWLNSTASGKLLFHTDYFGAANPIKFVCDDPLEFYERGVLLKFKTSFGSTWRMTLYIRDNRLVEEDVERTPLKGPPEEPMEW